MGGQRDGMAAGEGRRMDDRLGVCKETVWLDKKKLGREMRQNDKECGQRGALCYI